MSGIWDFAVGTGVVDELPVLKSDLAVVSDSNGSSQIDLKCFMTRFNV